MLEYVVGPVLALLLGMKFTVSRTKPPKYTHEEMVARIEQLEDAVTKNEAEMLKKVMTTVMPVAKAVTRINTQLGL